MKFIEKEFKMLKIKKLSATNLLDCIKVLFPEPKELKSEYRIHVGKKLYKIDYFVDTGQEQFAFEFDGPTHYTKSKTQLRDIEVQKYCKDNKIKLIRFPYFIQPTEAVLIYKFGYDDYVSYSMEGKIGVEYTSGFHDKEILYPGDWNTKGWNLFWAEYMSYIRQDLWSVAREIFDSMENKPPKLVVGVDWRDNPEKIVFIEEYPT